MSAVTQGDEYDEVHAALSGRGLVRREHGDHAVCVCPLPGHGADGRTSPARLGRGNDGRTLWACHHVGHDLMSLRRELGLPPAGAGFTAAHSSTARRPLAIVAAPARKPDSAAALAALPTVPDTDGELREWADVRDLAPEIIELVGCRIIRTPMGLAVTAPGWHGARHIGERVSPRWWRPVGTSPSAWAWSSDDAADDDPVIVTEGCTDALAALMVPAVRRIAALPSASDHAGLVEALAAWPTGRVVLAVDADDAGRSGEGRLLTSRAIPPGREVVRLVHPPGVNDMGDWLSLDGDDLLDTLTAAVDGAEHHAVEVVGRSQIATDILGPGAVLDVAQSQTVAQRPSIVDRIMFGATALDALPEPTWLVPGWIPERGLASIVAPSGVGKSFFALSLALAVSTGSTWLGHPVARRNVLYVAAEGAFGFRARLKAWSEHFGVAVGDGFRFLPVAANLADPQDVHDIAEWCAASDTRVVICDTWARSIPGVDEDSSTQVGLIIAECQRIIESCNGLVVAVHHTGKNVSAGARGSSAFRGALDTEITLERTGGTSLKATLTKQKESADGLTLALRLHECASSLVVGLDPQPPVRRTLEDEIVEVLSVAPAPMSGRAITNELGRSSHRPVNDALRSLALTGRVVSSPGPHGATGWALVGPVGPVVPSGS
jgi:AAA domain